jgi:putative multiple sugar transport system substrate-binding protein
MNMIKNVAVALAASITLSAVSVCAYAQDKGVIGISLPDKTESRWITDGKSMVDALKAKGYSSDLQCRLRSTRSRTCWPRASRCS